MLPASVVYRNDWAVWIRRYLHIALTDDQLALCLAVQQCPRVLGQSAHGCGKTLAVAAIALAFLYLYPDSEVILTSSSQWQVGNRLWDEVDRLWHGAAVKLGGELKKTQLTLGPRWKMSAVAVIDPSNLQGGHAPHVLLVMDEAQAVEKPIWDAFEGMMSGAHCRTLATFNPLFAGGSAHERTRKPDQWKLVKMSAARHPNVVSGQNLIPGAITREWVEDRKREWGEDSPLYVAKVLGEYPETSENTVITMADLEACAALKTPLVGDGMHMGVDVARYGSDANWAVVTVDGRVVVERSWSGLDTMATCGEIHQLVSDFDVPWEHVSIDGCGVGGGVVDRLRELDHDVNDVQLGAAPSLDWDDGAFGRQLGIAGTVYLNRKAELYWVLRTLLKRRMFSIPSRFERIQSDLLSTIYETRSDGRIKIEGKDEQRARLGRSPDAGDALVLSLARDLSGGSPMVTFI